MREGDIFRWSYTDEYLTKNKHEPYWCKSRIAVFDGKHLYDTFWGDKSHKINKNDIELAFVANFDELEIARPTDRAYYLDEDCVNLNHSNNSCGNFYIKKFAKKNIDKMERILRREKNKLEKAIESKLSDIERINEQLKNVTVNTYIYPDKEVILDDESYQDVLENN